ncbi:MAG: nucleoside deaminase [Deinococcota bacterium]
MSKNNHIAERDVEIMRRLIKYTWDRALENKTFTGAFIVKDNKVIQKAITSIEIDNNPLAHAELKALQAAISQHGPELVGCQLYTTQRPCPMCASAVAWSGVDKVVYGLRHSDYQWATFGDIHNFLESLGVVCIGPVLEKECKDIDNYLIAHGI